MSIGCWIPSLRTVVQAVVALAIGVAPSLAQAQASSAAAQQTEAAANAESEAEATLTVDETKPFTARVQLRAPDPMPPKFWLGVGGSPVDDVLKAQLGIDGGMVVNSVADESPAQQAGIQPHDILLKFGGKNVNQIEDLVESLKASTGETTDVVLLRSGEERTVQVTPQQRPTEHASEPPKGPMFRSLDELGQYYGNHNNDGVIIWNLQPGMLMPRDQLFLQHRRGLHGLPADVTITIKKPVEGAAQIDVDYAGKSWSVSDAEIDELPLPLRDPIRQLLHGGTPGQFVVTWADAVRSRQGLANALGVGAVPQVVKPVQPPQPRQATGATTPSAQGDVSQKLDAVLKKLEALQQEVNELKQRN